MITRTTSRPALAALAVLSSVLLSGCAGSSSATPVSPSAAADQVLHDALPPDVLARGQLTVVTEASYAPASAYAPDGRIIIGFEPDLVAALGRVLGVRVTVSNHPFDQLPALVTSGQADLVVSSMTDTAEREQTLDFVNYFSAGTSVVVQRGNPAGISQLADLCQHRVAVQDGTVQVDLLKHLQMHCDSPVQVHLTGTNDDALLELRTGRADAVLNDYPPAAALTTDPRTGARYQLASTVQYEPGLYGIGVARTRPGLRDAVQGALHLLMTSGEYARVLHAWHVEGGAVQTPTINASRAGGSAP